jgi:segregation and condensation protein B
LESLELKFAIEALLFASERPLTIDQIKQAFSEDLEAGQIRSCVTELKNEYESQGRGFKIFEIAGGFQIVSDPRFAEVLKKFYQSREKKRFSQAGLETLSVIAYKQPVTRADIEFIRGVSVDGALRTLLEKGLVKMVGKKEVPGRPMLYGTTDEFLEHFGLSSIKDLPALNQYTEKDLEEHLLTAKPAESQRDGQQLAVGCDNSNSEEPTP